MSPAVTLWHGTATPPHTVLTDGLKPCPIQDVLANVAHHYGIDPNHPAFADHIARKTRHPYVYLASTPQAAMFYAKSGGNFQGLLETEASALTGKPRRTVVPYLYRVGLEEIKTPAVDPRCIEVVAAEKAAMFAKREEAA